MAGAVGAGSLLLRGFQGDVAHQFALAQLLRLLRLSITKLFQNPSWCSTRLAVGVTADLFEVGSGRVQSQRTGNRVELGRAETRVGLLGTASQKVDAVCLSQFGRALTAFPGG